MRLREEPTDCPAIVVRDHDGVPALVIAPGLVDGTAFAAIGLALARFDDRGQHVENAGKLGIGDLVDDRVHRTA